ncbi:penicillin-binding protein 2 [Luteipulveratus sp. YIM 133132]|uniref:Penicillin-binding protein 2 n=1 Tax=Luteipulveratus flavus TaxID=3031728 RepID=A0ABT6C6P6_9MICO|nr:MULTISPECIES: penicillin-binding protein 2 [unclassified Luteipulveratus]MDE9366488.1 penicillin-binding protein 2 [Luteipulveratus sp. YIM 133132]MDF8264238.1 penicillin-binding protein 2 [Luteipulveratus sp. YIM 133296]
MLFVFSMFGVQLVRIQGLEAASVSEEAFGSRIKRVAVPAQRGTITDTHGVVLADSVDRRNIYGDSTAIAQYATRPAGKGKVKLGLPGAAKRIAPLLGLKESDLLALLQRQYAKKSQFAYLAKDVSPTQWRAVQELGVPGVFSERTVRREYPQGTSLAPLVGWVGSNGAPGGGVEALEQKRLVGKPGTHVYERDPNGQVIATGDNSDIPAVPGKDLRLTIDNDLQWYAQNALIQRVTETKALSGDVVVMEVKTGKIRAAASYPSFDPNDMASAPPYLQLRPFDEVYEPGSTSKVITMAALIDQGYATPTTPVTVPPTLVRAGRPFKDSESHGTEHMTLAGVLAHSSNMGTILAGEKMPARTLHDYMTAFGLGRRTGVGFPGESPGILAAPEAWKGDQRYTVMFGQGLAGTAVQQAAVFQTIANGGVRQPVSLVEGVGDGRGGFGAPEDDRKPQRVVSATTASQLTRMMQSVVSEEGTANAAAVPGYTVAGKTSTAERYDATLKKYSGTTASFIGFAPAQNPELVVAVTIQRPQAGIYGGPVSGPVFSKIMSFALQQRKVPPSGNAPQPYPLTTTPPATEQK